MKLLFQLCFLAVLAILCVSQGQSPTPAPLASDGVQQEISTPQQPNETSQDVDVDQKEDLNVSTTPGDRNGTKEETTNTSEPTILTPTSLAPVQPLSPEGEKGETSKGPTGDPGSTSTASDTTKPAASFGSTAWGYIILALILVLIVVLCIILFMLRRASRTYSFDLQRPVPSSNLYEPTGTFGQVYLDDLDRPVQKDVISDDLSTTPVPNGTSSQLEEKAAEEENAPQEQTEANDQQSSSTSSSSSSSSSGDEQAEKSNQMSSNNLFLDTVEEPQQTQQNENNNNPSVCSSDPFVEINLEEPAWSDQLLTSPQQTSSVLPFSFFSTSSSSSSSSISSS